jgi:hypothetical protein
MKFPVVIILQDKRKIVINEEQVCSIEDFNGAARIKMSNGDQFVCISPTFEQWENDTLRRDD